MGVTSETIRLEEPIMNYEFITTIATILLVGASLAGFMLQAIRAASRSTDARFAAVDAQLTIGSFDLKSQDRTALL